jgi:Protein of unknown function (DUF3131)
MQNSNDPNDNSSNTEQNKVPDKNKRFNLSNLIAPVAPDRGISSHIAALLLGLLVSITVILWPKSVDNSQSGNSLTANNSKPLLVPVYQKTVQPYLRAKNELDEVDIERARIAWKFFENNYQKTTGLINAADKYPSTTMWDTGSSLGATIAAYDLGLIDEREFDDRVMLMLGTLYEIKLFNNEAPNKVYNTQTATMVDYGNKPSEVGIGVSALDLARLASWLNILAGTHPKHATSARNVIQRWKLDNLIKDGQMYGLALDPVTKGVRVLQEGRLGYEQYAGKVFKMLGFDQKISATYNNEYKSTINIYDVPIAYDNRDPRKFGAYNYVVTESYVMDVFEHGFDDENTKLTNNIFEVQKRRWEKTGQVTAVSEDNVDRKPSFVYNTIFVAGSPWNAITDTGLDMEHLKSVSTKAAFTMAYLYPDDAYSTELLNAIATAYDPERGWYSGIYEKGLGYNDIITSNTNGVILTTMLYKKYGPLNRVLSKAGKTIKLAPQNSNAS